MTAAMESTTEATLWTNDYIDTNSTDTDNMFTVYDGKYIENKIAYGVWKYMGLCIICIGVGGNVLSFFVMEQCQFKGSITTLFLQVLAWVDTLVLVSGLLRQWLNVVVHVDMRNLSSLGCKVHIFLVYWSLQFSSWILALVTIERFLSITFPHPSKRYVTKRSAASLLCFVALVLFAVNVHFLLTYTLIATGTGPNIAYMCTISGEKLTHFQLRVWPWIDFTFYCFAPFFIIIFGNIGIIIRLTCSWYNKQQHFITGNGSAKMTNMTAILLTVTFYFILTTTPINVYLAIEYLYINNTDPQLGAKLRLWWAILNMLMYLNNSSNFFLYCLSGSRFRRQLRHMFCHNSVHPDTHITMSVIVGNADGN